MHYTISTLVSLRATIRLHNQLIQTLMDSLTTFSQGLEIIADKGSREHLVRYLQTQSLFNNYQVFSLVTETHPSIHSTLECLHQLNIESMLNAYSHDKEFMGVVETLLNSIFMESDRLRYYFQCISCFSSLFTFLEVSFEDLASERIDDFPTSLRNLRTLHDEAAVLLVDHLICIIESHLEELAVIPTPWDRQKGHFYKVHEVLHILHVLHPFLTLAN